VILSLGIYPNKCKSRYNRDTYTQMFIVALFTIAKLWKQPRCPITGEWINKIWYVYNMWFEGKWIQLMDIMFSEVTQS
jgi:hypothetical protein